MCLGLTCKQKRGKATKCQHASVLEVSHGTKRTDVSHVNCHEKCLRGTIHSPCDVSSEASIVGHS